MHIDSAGRQYTTVGGERRAYPCYLLRRSFRDEHGRPRKETLANLSPLPEDAIAALRKILKGATLVDAEEAFQTERSVPHGDVAAAHAMAAKLGLRTLLGPACVEREIAYALILSRAVHPESTLSTAGWWAGSDTTLGIDLGVAGVTTDEIYTAMDWLVCRQRQIEKGLTAITRVRDDFGIANLIMVGDRGMITKTRIAELRHLPGMDWITALKAPAITALARDDGPLQRSLFDEHNLAEITHPDYPGERLICCRNPFLAAERARKRQDLLAATAEDLATIKKAVDAGRLTGADEIGERMGKVIGKHKVGKHFIREITDTSFTYTRDEEKISAEAALDGIYVIRTSVPADTLDSTSTVTAYKNLTYVERDFRIATTDDLNLRPIYHYLDNRVRAHVLICMLAAYLTWHLRQTLAELTYTDQNIPPAHDPIAPAQRSAPAKTKDATKRNADNLPIRKYQDLLHHLATLDRQTIVFGGQKIEKLTTPTPVQRRAFELLGAPIPLTLQ
jgi:hypothetical protein